MSKKYKCVKGFSIDTVDGDCSFTGETMIVEKESIWEIDDDANKLMKDLLF